MGRGVVDGYVLLVLLEFFVLLRGGKECLMRRFYLIFICVVYFIVALRVNKIRFSCVCSEELKIQMVFARSRVFLRSFEGFHGYFISKGTKYGGEQLCV